MKTEDKAIDLFVRMLESIPDNVIKDNVEAKQLAKTHCLIAIDNIAGVDPFNKYFDSVYTEYWREVKKYIKAL